MQGGSSPVVLDSANTDSPWQEGPSPAPIVSGASETPQAASGQLFNLQIDADPASVPTGQAPPVPAAHPCEAVQNSGYQKHRACWEATFAEVARIFSPPSALAAVHNWRSAFPDLANSCHEYTHVIGRIAYDVYGDPFEALSFDDRTCQYGYRHGVFESFAGTEGPERVREFATTVCEFPQGEFSDEQYMLEVGECFHSVGHAAAVSNNTDVVAAVTLCDVYSDHETRRACAGGALMEFGNSFVLDKLGDGVADASHGPSTSRIDDATANNICTVLPENYADACYRRVANFWGPQPDSSVEKMVQRCSSEAGEHAGTCLKSVGEWAFRLSSSTPGDERMRAIAEYCMPAPAGELRGSCLFGAALPLRANDLWAGKPSEEWYELCDLADEESRPVCEMAEEQALESVANIPDADAQNKTSLSS